MDKQIREHISSELLGLINSTDNKALSVFGAYLAFIATVLATVFRGELDLPLGISGTLLGGLGFVVFEILTFYRSWKKYYLSEFQKLWSGYRNPDELPVPFVRRDVSLKGVDSLIIGISFSLAVGLLCCGMVMTLCLILSRH